MTKLYYRDIAKIGLIPTEEDAKFDSFGENKTFMFHLLNVKENCDGFIDISLDFGEKNENNEVEIISSLTWRNEVRLSTHFCKEKSIAFFPLVC